LKFICKKCGFEKDLPILKDIYYDIEDFKCSLCSELMTKQDDEDITPLLDQIVSETILVGMKNNISKLGNDKTWELIEKLFHNPKQRLTYRKWFILAGGEIPNKEEKI
jgi:hypothetical protein